MLFVISLIDPQVFFRTLPSSFVYGPRSFPSGVKALASLPNCAWARALTAQPTEVRSSSRPVFSYMA